jgi:hypothetical protein
MQYSADRARDPVGLRVWQKSSSPLRTTRRKPGMFSSCASETFAFTGADTVAGARTAVGVTGGDATGVAAEQAPSTI